jgi:hypothetical protein
MFRELFYLKEDVITISNVYIEMTSEKILNYIIYDNKYIYLNQENNYLNRPAVNYTISETDNLNIINLTGEYTCLLTQEAAVPSHNYEQFAGSFNSSFINNSKAKIIIYDTNDVFYNTLNNFIINNIFNGVNCYKIKPFTVYKIEKLLLYKVSPKNYLEYSKFLSSITKINNPEYIKQKYYNVKFNDDINLWTPSRGFNHTEEINDALIKYNYNKLDTSSEYNKQIQIQNCEKIILTWGGNHVINMMYSLLNANKEIMVLCSIKYFHEYSKNPHYKDKDVDNCYVGKYNNNNVFWCFDVDDNIKNIEILICRFENLSSTSN